MDVAYRNAFSEIYTLLCFLPVDYVRKIPHNIIKMFEELRNREHHLIIDLKKKILEQPLCAEARAILANIYRDYWCSQAERESILKREELERQQGSQNYFEQKNTPTNKENSKTNSSNETKNENIQHVDKSTTTSTNNKIQKETNSEANKKHKKIIENETNNTHQKIAESENDNTHQKIAENETNNTHQKIAENETNKKVTKNEKNASKINFPRLYDYTYSFLKSLGYKIKRFFDNLFNR